MFLGRVNIFRSALSGFRKKMIGEFREDVLSEIICKNIVKYIKITVIKATVSAPPILNAESLNKFINTPHY